MLPAMSTPDDPVASYLQTFEELRTRKRWSTQSVTFRFVALSLGAAASTIGYDRLEGAATDLRKRARWSSPLKSEIRYVVAAMILRRGLDPARIHECVFATRDGFKAHKVPSRGTGPTLAALHASREVPVDALAADVERAYTRLHDAGFTRGQQLQLVSQLLAVDPRGTDAGVDRFCDVANRLKSQEERVGPSRYDEVALLALTQGAAADVVDRVIRNRDRLRQAKARPDKSVAFTLAAGIELSADTERAGERSADDLAALQSIRAILDAQQAAMIAGISAAAAAGAAAGA